MALVSKIAWIASFLYFFFFYSVSFDAAVSCMVMHGSSEICINHILVYKFALLQLTILCLVV
jgi:hypothetical protein